MSHEQFIINKTQAQTDLLKLRYERGVEIVKRLTALNAVRFKSKQDKEEWDELEKQTRILEKW